MGKQRNFWKYVILCTIIGNHSEGIKTTISSSNVTTEASRSSGTITWITESTTGKVNKESSTMYLQNTAESDALTTVLYETSQVHTTTEKVNHSMEKKITHTVDTTEPHSATTQNIHITMTTTSSKHHQLSFVFKIQMGVVLISSVCILLAVFVTFIVYKQRKPNRNDLNMYTTDNVLNEPEQKQLTTQSLIYETSENTDPIGQHTTNGTLHECAQNMLHKTSGEDIEDHYHHLNFSLMNEEGDNIIHVAEAEYDTPVQQVQTEVDDIYEKPWDSNKLNNMVAKIRTKVVKGKNNLRKSVSFKHRRSSVQDSDEMRSSSTEMSK